MKKKILFIMGSLGGGAEKVLITLLHFFDYTRYDVDLCLLNRVGSVPQRYPHSGKGYLSV